MIKNFPCGLCSDEVGDNDDSVQCDLCNKWNHTRCLNIDAEQYEKLKKDPLPWYCPNCVMEIPFSTLSNKGLKTVLFGGSSKTLPKSFSKPFDKKTTEKLKAFLEVSQLFDQSENSVSCDYYTPYELNKIKVKQEDLSVLHLNISSLSAHIDDLKNFLSELSIKFDIICISESRLSQKKPQTTNINLTGYNIEQTPTESSAGGVLLYISQKFSYKQRKDLQIYCPKELESVFIELTIPNKPNFIVGAMYKHPSMQHYKFNNDFLQNLLNKIQTEKKFSVLAGEFDLNLIKYSKTTGISQFLEIILSHPSNNTSY